MSGAPLKFTSIISAFFRSGINNLKFLPKTSAAPSASIRHSSFQSSNIVRDLKEYPEVEVIHNPPEWKYVERILAPQVVPTPIAKPKYPSGWKPPSLVNENRKFFVARTRNHMIPVYLHRKFRGLRRITVVRFIQGDIWSLEKELRAVIEKSRNGRICASRVNELSGQIHFHGDYVDLVRDYLMNTKGF